MFKRAIVETPPVFPDRQRTVQEALDRQEAAAGEDAGLVVFPEVFVRVCPARLRRMLDIVSPSARPDRCEPRVDRQPKSTVAFA